MIIDRLEVNQKPKVERIVHINHLTEWVVHCEAT